MKAISPLLRLRAIAAAVASWNARGRNFELDQVIAPRSNKGSYAMPVQSDGGWGNLDRSHIFGKTLGQHYDPVYHRYFNDFDVYAAGDWTITDTGAGTSALVQSQGGVLQIKNDDGVINHFREHQLVKDGYLYVAGDPMMFSARLKVDSANLGVFAVGLQSINTNPFQPPADGIWFSKTGLADGHVDFNVSSTAAGLATKAAVVDVADNTFISLEWAYDGEGNIWFGANGKVLGSVGVANAPAAVNLAPVVALKNGSGVARTLQLDYLFAAKKR